MALDTNQRDTIVANCSTIKVTIAQVRRADTVARIKRGRSYEQTSKLLGAMNAHLGYNSISQPLLTDMTSDFRQAFADYQTAFQQYEQTMEEAERINCPSDPDGFYAHLALGRTYRQKMASQVVKAENALKVYRQGVDDLRASITKGETE